MRNIHSSAQLEEIWALFARESRDNLAMVEECLMTLGKDPDNAAQFTSLFYAINSFKDGSRILGLSVMESLAYRAESLIALVRIDGAPLEIVMTDLLLTTVSRLRVLLDQVLAHRQDAEPAQVESLVASLQEMIARASASVGKPGDLAEVRP